MNEFPQKDLWLIHKIAEHKIHGPVELEKIKLMLEQKKLNPEDALQAANGFWIKVRETELIQKFVFDKISMPFHPSSCMLDDNREFSLGPSTDSLHQVQQAQDSKGKPILIPAPEDLEYPIIKS